MKKAAVIIDAYKLPTFDKHLTAAGYKFNKIVGKDVIILQVEYEWVAKLQPVIEAANKECEGIAVWARQAINDAITNAGEQK